MLDRETINRAIADTEFLDGLTIEGNNHKLAQLLSLREHLIKALDVIDTQDKTNTKLLSNMKTMLEIQCTDGTWNYDPYMHGMANGMLYMESLVTAVDPVYLDAPDVWLKDIETEKNRVSVIDARMIPAMPSDGGDS